MKTMVNIGTNIKNIVGVEFNKPFNDITYEEIIEVVRERMGNIKGVIVQGWADVSHTRKAKKRSLK